MALSGCGLFRKSTVPVVEASNTLNISAELLQPCPLLDPKEPVSFQGVVEAYSDLAIKYSDCSNKQFGAVQIIKQFGNIK